MDCIIFLVLIIIFRLEKYVVLFHHTEILVQILSRFTNRPKFLSSHGTATHVHNFNCNLRESSAQKVPVQTVSIIYHKVDFGHSDEFPSQVRSVKEHLQAICTFLDETNVEYNVTNTNVPFLLLYLWLYLSSKLTNYIANIYMRK